MKSEILLKYGQVVRKIRLEKGISQETLADLSGLHRTYMSDVELGKRNVSLENIDRIANALGVSISEIFKQIGKHFLSFQWKIIRFGHLFALFPKNLAIQIAERD